MNTLAAWIRKNTQASRCVVDFGAGFFDKLAYVPPMVKKIGIEVFPPYLAHAKPGIQAICADMMEWERFVSDRDRDTAMLIDTIEHLTKEEGLTLLNDLCKHFRLILVMTPQGFMLQGEDVTGYENEWQIHRSGDWEPDLRELGFDVVVEERFHGKKGDALFAVWTRDERGV